MRALPSPFVSSEVETQLTKRSALTAAELAVEASKELLRFHREGPDGDTPFGDPEPVHQLAEALMRTATIEAALYPDSFPDPAAYREGLGQLTHACLRFLEDHCGGAPILESGVPY